jgi:uncharacterized protein (DUF4415 family)
MSRLNSSSSPATYLVTRQFSKNKMRDTPKAHTVSKLATLNINKDITRLHLAGQKGWQSHLYHQLETPASQQFPCKPVAKMKHSPLYLHTSYVI